MLANTVAVSAPFVLLLAIIPGQMVNLGCKEIKIITRFQHMGLRSAKPCLTILLECIDKESTPELLKKWN